MTAVEWLIDQINKHWDNPAVNSDELIKQANKMFEQQIIDAYKKYQSYLIEEFLINEQAHKGITMHKPFEGNSKTFEQWVETYGSGVLTEGSGAVGDKGGAVSKGSDERIVESNKTINSQTEISDEKIKEFASESKSIFKEDMYRAYFIMGAKWYREQLKKKQ